MKTIFSILMVGLLIVGCQTSQSPQMTPIDYPETRKSDHVDTYFDHEVADPYRWLEDDLSDETAAWVEAENKVTNTYLSEIPYRDQLRDRLEDIWNYEKYSAPFKEGDYTYYYKNDGLQNQSVVWRQKDGQEPEVFLDPNTFSDDGTTSLASLSFSSDGSHVAYSISEGGSDWRKAVIMNAETKEVLDDTLVDLKFTGLSWYKNEGIYYASYDKPDGSELSAKTDQHKVYYHKVGTAQSDDQIIFGEKEKWRYVGARVTDDNRFLVVSAAQSTSGNNLFIKDLTYPASSFKTIQDDINYDSYVMHNVGSDLFIVTNKDAPNKKIVKASFSNPTSDHWVDLIAETDNVLSARTGGGYIFAEYMKDAISLVNQYDMDGNLIREVDLPGIGSIWGFGGKEDQESLYYTFTNYTTPGTIYSYNPNTGESEVYKSSNINFDIENYTSEQVFFTSKDGTKVPMIITYKKSIEKSGQNPTLLYGYGGFNASLTPYFSTSRAVWMEQGGILAVANLRGGGEYGKEWHKAGTKMNKQNVFDDFIAAAEYLIANQYTDQNHLAIQGGSNGGLLVGAVMTQRPELFQVALPAVGVMDMLRYHTFTAGAGWAYDYGTSEDSEDMFEYLKGYSPIHNLKAGTKYPATLVTTADHDDRVVPAHSFKFAATLQEHHDGDLPVLIRIETNAGHGAGKPVSKMIDESADIYSFTLWNMGIDELQ